MSGYLSKIAGSFVGVVIGLVFLPGATALLFWNEGRAVTTAKSLKEGEGVVIAAEADTVNPGYDQKLVHATSQAATGDVLKDPVFGVSANAIRLGRAVQMYQWKESTKTETHKNTSDSGGTVTDYVYEKSWEDEPIDSSHFRQPQGHANPKQMLAQKFTATAKKVTFGAFKLPPAVISRMPGDETLPMDNDALKKLPASLKAKARISEDDFYFGSNPQAPEIGDQKVRFTVLKPGTFSIAARQTGNSFEAYSTHAGRDILLVEAGDVAADSMFKHAETQNKIFTWVLRGAGVFVMFLGLTMLLSPITEIAHLVPIVGDIIGIGAAAAALLLSVAISMVTISIAWITYRPLLGGTMLAGAIVWFVLIKHHGARKVSSRRRA